MNQITETNNKFSTLLLKMSGLNVNAKPFVPFKECEKAYFDKLEEEFVFANPWVFAKQQQEIKEKPLKKKLLQC